MLKHWSQGHPEKSLTKEKQEPLSIQWVLAIYLHVLIIITLVLTILFIYFHEDKISLVSCTCVGMAKAIFSTWYSCFQTISFMGHILIKDPSLDSVTFMASFPKFALRYLFETKPNLFFWEICVTSPVVTWEINGCHEKWTYPNF